MHMQPLGPRIIALLVGITAFALSGWAAGADPPSRVARLGYTTGAVSFSPAGENEWVRATINRPLTTGDRLWADVDARAELQMGGAAIRMGDSTSVTLLNLDDNVAQVQLAQGTLNVRVRRLSPRQLFEVDTPNLAFTIQRPGDYRIEVDPASDATTVVVRDGQCEVYGEGAAYVVDSRQSYRFKGTGLRDYQAIEASPYDEFDRWARERDRRGDHSESARYVSRDVIGYEDLDANGAWRNAKGYGKVWTPNRVAAGWTPYHDGHWAWIDPWGWTWVDDAPWGFAVSHYGRWVNLGGSWCWVPGPVRAQAVYAPALVAFVGGNSVRLAISGGNDGGVAWFPLGPREVYRPSYPVSRGYFDNINRSNTVINDTTITNVYNNTNVTNIVYANQQVQGAVIAVPATAFVQSRPVSRVAVRMTQEMIVSAPVSAVAAVAPVQQSVYGAAGPGGKPPVHIFDQAVIAHRAPPATPVGFAAREQHLVAKPGRPLDPSARAALKPVAPVLAPHVIVVAPAQAVLPTKRPPTEAPGTKPGGARGIPDDRKAPAAPAVSSMPPAPPPGVAPRPVTPPQAAPHAPVAQPPQPSPPPRQRERPEPRGKLEPHGPPVAPPLASPPQAAPHAPVAQPPQPSPPPRQRERPEQRARPEPRGPSEPRGNPEPAPAVRQAEPRQPAVAPQSPQAPQPQSQPNAAHRGPKPKPDTGDQDDKKKSEFTQ
jgi:hypothetical protein